MREITLLFFLLYQVVFVGAQCEPVFSPPLSDRTANYDIDLVFDPESKSVDAAQTLTWINTSPETIHEFRMYLYLNAFKNMNTTFMKGAGRYFFGDDMALRSAEEWGWVQIDSIGSREGAVLTDRMRFIQPNDGNPDDHTVLSITLDKAIFPGDTLVLDMTYTAKLPRTIVRSGYSKDDYFNWVHWFPQAGVYEELQDGNWGWNCHQFQRSTEYYSDFGTYRVQIDAPEQFVIGTTGCQVGQDIKIGDRVRRVFYAEDVIDFAWVAYPYFEEIADQWEHVAIRLLVPPEHRSLAPRFIGAVKNALTYLTEHVGEYPYPIITMVDPPVHALNTGFMEYPNLITMAACYGIPRGLRTVESLVIHEFTHQYFMGMVATNEKEEAWMDEGITTYFEDRIMEASYPGLIKGLGYVATNRAFTRNEYVSLDHPSYGTIARPSWEIEGDYKGLIYSKTATVLHTLQGLLGRETTDELFRTYFVRWKFKHPKAQDFIDVVNEVVADQHGNEFGENMNWFFDQCLYGTGTCDYAVAQISNERIFSGQGMFDAGRGKMEFRKGEQSNQISSSITVHRLGELIFPVELLVCFEDGNTERLIWDGKERTRAFDFTRNARIISAELDPERKLYLDTNFNNNSITLEPGKLPLWKYMLKAVFWVQGILQTVGFLV